MPVHEIDTSAAGPDVVVPTIGAVGAALLGVRYPGWSWQAWNSVPPPPSIALPSPIALPDKTSGFNGIAGHDLKN